MTKFSNRPNLPSTQLAVELIQKPSVTPIDAGVMDVVQARLQALGFICTRYPFGEGAARVDNLYARFGEGSPNFCFAGHVDVVPAGEVEQWSDDPFGATVRDGKLWGRGAADMKGAIAAYITAVETQFASGWRPEGALSFLITGDEEGVAQNGTKKLLKAISDAGEVITDCVVGEPTNPNQLGDMIKNGRRGSINTDIIVTGTQGHVAYPHRAVNPVPALLSFLSVLQARELDQGSEFFDPSNLEVTTIDIGNPTENLIPAKATARLNIRFNVHHSGASLSDWMAGIAAQTEAQYGVKFDLTFRISGESFLTAPGKLTDVLQASVEAVTGRRPELSTTGGTSDARFITHYANVAEFGLVGATMHQVDEHVDVADIEALSAIYAELLQRYFA